MNPLIRPPQRLPPQRCLGIPRVISQEKMEKTTNQNWTSFPAFRWVTFRAKKYCEISQFPSFRLKIGFEISILPNTVARDILSPLQNQNSSYKLLGIIKSKSYRCHKGHLDGAVVACCQRIVYRLVRHHRLSLGNLLSPRSDELASWVIHWGLYRCCRTINDLSRCLGINF